MMPSPCPPTQPLSDMPRMPRAKSASGAILDDKTATRDLIARIYHGGLPRRDGALRLIEFYLEAALCRSDQRVRGLMPIADADLRAEGLARRAAKEARVRCAERRRGEALSLADDDGSGIRDDLEHIARAARPAAEREPSPLSNRKACDLFMLAELRPIFIDDEPARPAAELPFGKARDIAIRDKAELLGFGLLRVRHAEALAMCSGL